MMEPLVVSSCPLPKATTVYIWSGRKKQQQLRATSDNDEAIGFTNSSKTGNLVPLCRCIFSDQLTPVLAYRCLVREGDWESPSFLLESVEQGSPGRYSVVGAHPNMEIVAKENKVVIMDNEKGWRMEDEYLVDDPMEIPSRIMQQWKCSLPQLAGHCLPLNDAFCGEMKIMRQHAFILKKPRSSA